MSTGRRLAVAGVVAVAVALAPAGIASADNNNNNTNTNDVTQNGGADFSAGSSNENTNWPPTDLGWPPKEILTGGESENENGGNNNGRNESASAPIVMPSGQSPPEPTHTSSRSEAPKPIVDVSSP